MGGSGRMNVRGVPVTAVLITASQAAPHVAAVLVRGGVELLATVAPGEAEEFVARRGPHVAVVELDGGAAPLEAVAALSAAAPHVPVVTLSGRPDHAVALAAVRAGATSHLAGPVAPIDLGDAVRRTSAGEVVFSPGLADVLLEEFGRPAGGREESRPLTEREADVVRLVVEGFTARQIASRLVLSPRTVENHVQNVLRKLHLHSRAALVRYAIEHGIA
ncbi:response regulator transcription factor [Pseudonocardia sp. MH-G8]|uniref:response regulator transcription factor n=1 Tax=Pseudonocardia sp. MH-G8 TaxID=1854588 RepID=UPI000BA09C63|nr:response regulator transcription factor [Pseudonocardia sp. MH-G8]OZM81833.1 DNA-binding response regulator [Pseudonocardia sp. MH-G8]